MARWDDTAEYLFETLTQGTELTDRELDQLGAQGYDVDDLRDMFDRAFLDHSDDSELSYEERYDMRQELAEILEELGYYIDDDFDWDAWRDWMGYEG